MTNRRSQMTIHGWVGTTPELRETANGNKVASFRIADSVRQRDSETGNWIDVKTTWYTVRMWGRLAVNAAESLRKSDPVVITGHPWLDTWTNSDGEPVTQLIIDAHSIGPDLTFGTSRYSRTVRLVDDLDKADKADAKQASSVTTEAASDTGAGDEDDTDPATDPITGELIESDTDDAEIGDTHMVAV